MSVDLRQSKRCKGRDQRQSGGSPRCLRAAVASVNVATCLVRVVKHVQMVAEVLQLT